MSIQRALARVVDGHDLGDAEMTAAVEEMLGGGADPAAVVVSSGTTGRAVPPMPSAGATLSSMLVA